MKNYSVDDLLNSFDLAQKEKFSTYFEIKELLDEALNYSIKCVCVYPQYVKWAKKYIGKRCKICAVLDLSRLDYKTSIFAIKQCVRAGADEIEFLPAICELKSGNVETFIEQSRSYAKACGSKISKMKINELFLNAEELSTLLINIHQYAVDYIVLGEGKRRVELSIIKRVIDAANKKCKIKLIGDYDLNECFNLLKIGANRVSSSKAVNEFKIGEI